MWISREGVTGIAHGFSEYVFGYQRISLVRAERRRDAAALATCDVRPLAIGIPYSCNNIFHQTFHAVPAWEQHAATAAAHREPPPTFVPIVYSTTAIGKKMSEDPALWHAWEFSVRPFSTLSAAQIAADTQRLLRAPCTCFARVEANAPAFNPNARHAATRLRAFREAALRSVRAMPDGVPPAGQGVYASAADAGGQLLYVARRHAKRAVVNGAALEIALSALPEVRRVRLEELSLAAQMLLFNQAAGLIAVHGQAMAWVLFLPSERRRVAAVEIFPGSASQTIYKTWCRVLGVHYQRLSAPIAGGCATNRMNWLTCNVSVDVDQVVQAARIAVKFTK